MIDSASARTVGSSSATSTASGVDFFVRVLATGDPPYDQRRRAGPGCSKNQDLCRLRGLPALLGSWQGLPALLGSWRFRVAQLPSHRQVRRGAVAKGHEDKVRL